MTYDSELDMDSSALRQIKDEMGYEDTERGEKALGDRSERSQQRRYVVTAEHTSLNLSYHPSGILLYSPPRQRQKWGETQVLPRVNWGDLFFDLFYVAATYNVSYILTDQPDREGLLYAAGTFLPVMAFWLQKVYYDGRFVYEDDLFHRFSQIALLLVLATAVVHIRPVVYMSNASDVFSMFCFSLMMVLGGILSIVMWVEVYFFGVGQRQNLRYVAVLSIRLLMCALVFYAAALLVAAREYYGGDDGSGGYRRVLAGESKYDDTSDYNKTNAGDNGTSDYNKNEYGNSTNTPIWLILAGHAFYSFALVAHVVFFFPKRGRHKEFTTPINVDFVMHRNGEWTMLMLGESVFSLLIVNVPQEGSDFFVTFLCGILTVVFLYHLHFQSQPHDPDSHALRRDKNAGVVWSLFQQIYSLSLVALGASFTFFLEFFGRQVSYDRRHLAEESKDDTKQEKANILFCLSLAAIFFCLDMMTLLHLGVKESQGRCVCKHRNKYRFGVIFLTIVRAGIVLFTATLYKWESEPKNLAFIGLLIVVWQLFMRRVGGKYAAQHGQVHAAH